MAVPQPPAPPTNLTATPGDGQITLTFTPTPGATSHRLYFSNQPTVSRTTGTLLGTVTSPTLHQGLMNGVTWYYVVTALNAAGESAESEVASAIPSSMAGQTSPQVLVRRPLAGVNGVRVGTRVDARFDRDLDGVSVTTANVTLARLDGGIVTGSTTSAGPSLAFTPSLPLAFETSYRVTLGTGLRDTLNQNLAAPDSWTFTTGAPPPVVTAYAGNGAATITWTAVPGATHYVVTHLVVPSLAEEHTVTGTVFTETSMSNGQIHTFSVAAVTSFGRGTASNEVPITAQPSRPGIPSSLEVSVGHTTALLTWSPVSNATGYTIYRANDPGGPFTVAESGFQGTTWLDSNLPASPVWAYVVQAESAGGTGAWARAVAGSTDPSRLPAPNVTASAGNGWVRLTWAAVPGAEEYVVLRGTWPNNNPARLGTAAGTRFDDLVAYNGQTYRYFVGAVGADQVVGDLVEETVSPVAGLPLPAPVMSWPAVEVNRVSLSAASLVAGTTQQFFRAPTPDGGFVPVSSIETIDGGTTWYYAARSSLGGVTSELSLPIAVTHAAAVVPAMPQNVTAFVASGSADVAFDPVPNATGYQVGSSTSPGGTPTVRCSTADPWENRCLVSLTDNQTVYLSVRALNGSTPGPWSSEVMARPTNFGPTAGLPAPSLEATFGNGIATVSWTHVPGATEYRVFRRTRSSPFVLLGTTSALSLTDSTVINGTDYRYALLATNGTSRFAPTQLTVFDQPSALELRRPTNVTVTPTNNGALVRWRPVAGAVSYGVRASTFTGGAPSAYDTSCTSPDPYGTTCQLNLANFTPYSVQVIAYGPGGTRSAWTDAVPVTPTPAAPAASPGLALTAANGRLVLTASTTAGASYRLFRRTPDTPFVGLGLFPTPFFSESQPNGVAFQYALQVVTAQGESPLAITPFVSPSDSAPPPPVLREVSAGDGTAWVWWEPVEGASSYTVMTAPGPDGPYSAAVSVNSARQTTTTITSLTNGTPVWVAVAATSASGTSARSTELMAQPAASTLDAPIVTLINGNQAVQLSWPTVAGATGYQVLRRPADGAWSTAASLTARRFTDLDVENGESWQYQVRAVGPAGPGPGSGASPSQSVLASIPTVPTGVTVRPANGGLFVEWAPSPLATGYFVSLSPEADGPLTPVCNVTGQWETRCLAITTAARFVFVQALAPGETSIASAPRPGTPDPALPAQGSLSVSAPGPAGSLQVTWFAVSGATGYRVYRRPLNGAATQVHQTTTTTPFVDTGLTSGQTYVYYLEAENAAGRGAWSTPDSEVAP